MSETTGAPAPSEPGASRPFAPQPFAPAPTQPQAGGCSKPLLVGCGVVFLLLGVAAIVFLLQARSLLVWMLGEVRQQVVTNLPADVTAADRDRFERAFAAAVAALEANRADPVGLQRLQGDLLRIVQRPAGKLTREDLLSLTESLEAVGGVAAPEEAPSEESPRFEESPPAPAASEEPPQAA
jgi:hypothetical protein